MNTIGNKMNNKLTNVIGNKFANKFNSMGYKMMPNQNVMVDYMKPMSNLISDNLNSYIGSKKIINTIDTKKKNKLTR